MLKTLLVTCRDIGAALHLSEFLRWAENCNTVRLITIASGPAYRHFQNVGISSRQYEGPLAYIQEDPAYQLCEQFLAEVVESNQIDAAIVGATGFGLGIDEVTLEFLGPQVPVFCLQDGWGSAFTKLSCQPRALLVVQKPMAKHFASTTGVKAVHVGALRYLTYKELDTGRMRDLSRVQWDLAPETTVCGFFGQPIEHPSYIRMLLKLQSVLCDLDGVDEVIYFLHPGEVEDEPRVEKLKQYGIEWPLVQTASVEEALTAVDVVLSGFSSSLTALTYLQSISPKPLAAGAFSLFSLPFREILQRSSGREHPLEFERGLLRALYEESRLESELGELLGDQEREAQWKAAQEVRLPEDTPDKMLEVIGELARW